MIDKKPLRGRSVWAVLLGRCLLRAYSLLRAERVYRARALPYSRNLWTLASIQHALRKAPPQNRSSDPVTNPLPSSSTSNRNTARIIVIALPARTKNHCRIDENTQCDRDGEVRSRCRKRPSVGFGAKLVCLSLRRRLVGVLKYNHCTATV
jgi:hypothetical protein